MARAAAMLHIHLFDGTTSSVKEQTTILNVFFFPPSLDGLGQEFSLSYAQLSLPQGLDVQQMSTVADLQLCTSIKVLRGKSCHLGTKPSRGLEVPKEALSPI